MNNDKDKVVLKDGTVIDLDSSQGIRALHTLVESKEAVIALWKKFTEDNLTEVVVKNSDGLVFGRYYNMVLDHIEAKDNPDTPDTPVRLTLSLRDKTTDERFEERIGSLESEQQMHDEAIGDLGQAVAEIAEGGAQ